MRIFILTMIAAIALNAAPVFAGNIVLTGHDNDFHYNSGSAAAGVALQAEAGFIRDGSTLPILTFDAGSELTNSFSNLGISYFNVDPSNATNITDSLFDYSTYSAFAVASVQSCGGCDNSPAAIDNIAAHSAAIADFFNDGGGILGLAGAGYAGAYAYVPESATNGGGFPPSSGYVQTSDGAALGLPAVNGDPTHNFFDEPGSGGLSSAYVVTERLYDANTGTPETIALENGVISGGGIHHGGTPTSVPEPGSLGLFGLALLGLGFAVRRRGHNGIG